MEEPRYEQHLDLLNTWLISEKIRNGNLDQDTARQMLDVVIKVRGYSSPPTRDTITTDELLPLVDGTGCLRGQMLGDLPGVGQAILRAVNTIRYLDRQLDTYRPKVNPNHRLQRKVDVIQKLILYYGRELAEDPVDGSDLDCQILDFLHQLERLYKPLVQTS